MSKPPLNLPRAPVTTIAFTRASACAAANFSFRPLRTGARKTADRGWEGGQGRRGAGRDGQKLG